MNHFTEAHRRAIADTGIRVSPLGLGTVKLGRNTGVKYPAQFQIPDDRQAADLIALAADLGINLIDTAPAYGNSEERLGKLLRGQRDRWVICSKTGEEFDGQTSSFDFSAAHTRKSVERTLQRLHTDVIDIVLIHSNGDDEHILRNEAALTTLQQLKQEGLIRAIGASIKTVAGGLIAADHCDVVMASYHPNHTDEAPVLDACQARHRAVFLKKALASGHLANDLEDPVQQSFDFAFAHDGVTAAIVGTINQQHLAENVSAAVSAIQRS